MMEFPLVLFTIFSQLGVGAFITLYILRRQGNLEEAVARLAAYAVVAVTGLSMCCSMLHLGDPFGAYRAIFHVQTSWLSREILFFGGFFGLAFIYCLPRVSPATQRLLGFFGCVAGVCGVVSSALIYTLPARPAWDSAFPMLLFVFTAVALGPALVMAIASWKKVNVCRQVYQFTALVLGLILICTLAYFTSMRAMLQLGTGLAIARIIIGLVLPVLLILARIRHGGPIADCSTGFLLFFLIFVGELMGRIIFYDSVLPYPMFGL